ncbi:hypothetical protein WOLCODRAFT_97200 [Wolfiporia cocos MD-104 SS10]|uniref:Uncharacterized protein n=1 Tax=Wolfiporia cocos (strain MD-104) TaxID=742152 RepID=A0A2H3JFA0_WOLCO|nr:hypothetical protein WOLCODRAFT_97200 [Wolfiporia cocos MD-104 SS10]
MRHADSITVDPHKSGYVPYPAGGLCYRDERARYLITWTGPYIDGGAGAAAAMGVFGLEGSKPGAAPVAAYVAHEVLGLHRGGYGALLGEAMFTSVKMYSHWVTMGLDSHTLLVTPLTMLPAERDGAGAEAVEAQRRYIRECITNRPNRELVQDAEAMTLVKQMGSDLSINAFACNFRVSRGGPPNRDVAEASYLNARIIERLSVTRVDDEAQSKPLILMGTELDSERYGECLRKFKGRLGLDEDDDAPLAGLCNVSMSVFPTTGNFVAEMAEAFRKVAEEEVENCWKRIQVVPAIHSFVMHGTSTLYLTYLPIFNLGSYRQQLIFSAKLPKEVMDAYAQAQRASPGAVFTVHTSTDELLSSVLQRGKCMVDIRQGLPPLHGYVFNADAREFSRLYVELTDIVVIKHTSLAPRNHSKQYPKFMPFFLYGSPEQLHIDHVLLKSPNAQLSCSGVGLELEGEATVKGLDLQKGVIVVLDEIREHASQPYGRSHQPEFFASGRSFNASVYADPFDGKYSKHPVGISSLYEKLEAAQPLAKGRITLGDSVYVDATHLNCDTVPKLCITPREKLTLDQLMLSATTDYEKIKKDFAQVASHSRAIASADIEQHIVANATLSDKYVLRPADEASFGEDQPTLQISRFAFSGPSDKHSRKLAVRQGWKDAFDQALVDYKVQSANRPVIHT